MNRLLERGYWSRKSPAAMRHIARVVFRSSLVLTLIVAALTSSLGSAFEARLFRSLSECRRYWHLTWFFHPRSRGFTPITRWVAIMWLAAMLAATALVIPCGLLSEMADRPAEGCPDGRPHTTVSDLNRQLMVFTPTPSTITLRFWGSVKL